MAKIRRWFRDKVGSVKIWAWTWSEWLTAVCTAIIDALPDPRNYEVRLFFFIIGYLILTVIGLKNMAILLGFVYVTWLLEKGRK